MLWNNFKGDFLNIQIPDFQILSKPYINGNMIYSAFKSQFHPYDWFCAPGSYIVPPPHSGSVLMKWFSVLMDVYTRWCPSSFAISEKNRSQRAGLSLAEKTDVFCWDVFRPLCWRRWRTRRAALEGRTTGKWFRIFRPLLDGRFCCAPAWRGPRRTPKPCRSGSSAYWCGTSSGSPAPSPPTPASSDRSGTEPGRWCCGLLLDPVLTELKRDI